MSQPTKAINVESLQFMLDPINLEELAVSDPDIRVGGMAKRFDASANRLLDNHVGSLELLTKDAILTISCSWRNTLEGFGWVGPPSPWYEDYYDLEIASFDEPEAYPDERLKQFVKFVSSSVLMPGKEKTRSRTVSLEFGTQSIVPTVPEMCDALGIPTPESKNIKPYKVEEATAQAEVKRRADLKRAFNVGVVIMEALDPETVRKLKKK